MNRFFKLSVLLPVFGGVVTGGLLFLFGAIDDAPGICAIGLSIGFFFAMLGINNSGIIKKGLLAPILFFCYGVFVVVLTTAILFDGEFGNKPWLSAIGYVIAAVLILEGIRRFNVYQKYETRNRKS
jgi:hypothetical protein